MTVSEERIERAALAILAARGIKMSGLLPPDAIWLAYPKKQALTEARAAAAVLLEDDA